MSTSVENLYQKALDLGEKERAALSARLIESLDTEAEEGVEAAWLAEVERRMEELDSGTVQSIPWEEVVGGHNPADELSGSPKPEK